MNIHTSPLVHGYLCVLEQQQALVGTWTREITTFSLGAGYRLGSMFIDRCGATGSFARGAFIELLATLRRPEASAAVVPSLAHLSPDTFTQQALVQMVRLTDSQLLVSNAVDGSGLQMALAASPEAKP